MKTVKLVTLLLLNVMFVMSCSKKDENNNTPDPDAVVQIPDANFKTALLDQNPNIDTNNDSQIQVSEAEAATDLWLEGKGITNLSGLEAFTNLEVLRLSSNTTLSTIDISQNTNLRNLDAPFTDISSLDLSNNEKLQRLNVQTCLFLSNITYPTGQSRLEDMNLSETIITGVPFSQLTALKYIALRDSKITDVDMSGNEQLQQIWANNNPQLTSVNLKNGKNQILSDIDFTNCTNLSSICVDDVTYANAQDPDRWKKDQSTSYTSTCN